ncbi:hypothetical protein DdX_20420 [Ditylenchus destructor]|uniref:Uncharacterized protein n=1 Tax=Ditylenchus destructor TaxID=166010 RepID=A0AAD4MLD8_9BILA|nr:hypothetical protein DdX_20420 [Ditylenchus destructor]
MAKANVAKYFSNEDSANEIFSDSVFSNGFIIEKLLDGNEQFRGIMQSSKIKTMSGKDMCATNGVTSQIYLISIELLQEDGKSSDQPTFSAIMKAFNTERIEALFQNMMNINTDTESDKGQTECDFYSLFGNISKEIMPIPDIYYIQKTDMEKSTPGVIIMEDLTESGWMASVYDGLTVQQVKTIVYHLAAFHHFLLCETDDNWSEVLVKSAFEKEEDFAHLLSDDMIEKVIEWNRGSNIWPDCMYSRTPE